MTTLQSDTRGGYTRRAVLGAVGLGLSSGCVQRTRGLANRRSPEQVALTIKTVPADTDRTATRIARLLTANLEAVGIDAEVALLSEDELYRDVLINHEFDIYVARTETQDDPDSLRELLHSSFNEEAGWQNPFGYSDLTMDELLDEQRKQTGGRRETVFEIQRRIAQEQPFTVIGQVESINAIRRDRFRGWEAFDPTTPTSCLLLEPRSDEVDTLSVTSTDERITRNFNPLAVEFRNNQQITELLYDPLAHRNGGESQPWLAESWSWDTDVDTTATVNLRSDSRWHDGTDLTADDVVFTYQFLQDTTMDDEERTVPAPRFRGQTSLVEAVERIDYNTVRFEFGNTSPEVAKRAFTVPVLPAHVWEERTEITDVPGIGIFDGATEALVWDNSEPVGSGPMQFVSSQTDEEVVLRKFEDHVLSNTPEEIGGEFDGGIQFDNLHVLRSPTDETAIEFVASGEADATTAGLSPPTVPQVIDHQAVELTTTPTTSFYHIGYNVREGPLTNPRFRRAIASTIDKEQIVEEILGGFGTPSAAPITDPEWLPEDLRWDGTDPEVPFAGTNGELAVESVKENFREVGYQYSDDGQLRTR